MTDSTIKIYLENNLDGRKVIYNDTVSPGASYSRDIGYTGSKPKGIMPVNEFSWARSEVYGAESADSTLCTYTQSNEGVSWKQEIIGRNIAALGATSGEFYPPDFGSFPPPPLSEGGTTTKAYNKASQVGFDVLTEIGEGPETVRMFYKAAVAVSKNITTAYRRLRKGKVVMSWGEFRSFVDGTAKASDDHWMAYRYGVRPVINSVSNFHDWYKNHDRRNGGSEAARIIRGRNTSTSTTTTKTASKGRLVSEGGIDSLMHYQCDQKTVREIRVSCGILERWVATNGLIFNPVTTGWELVPLSFVIDWFTNFGDQLTYASYRVSSMMREPAWVSVVTCDTQTSVLSCFSEFQYAGSLPLPEGVTVSGHYSGSLTVMHRSYHRRPGSLPPLVTRPDFYANVSMAKIIDMIILIKQRIR